MTYDDWKTRSPDDDWAMRQPRRRLEDKPDGVCMDCWRMGIAWDEPAYDGSCYECGRPVGEPFDPDAARDERMDRGR